MGVPKLGWTLYKRQWRAKNKASVDHSQAKYRTANIAKIRKRIAAWVAAHRKETRARQAVGRAVKRGILHKPTNCTGCDRPVRLYGHHEDYNRPLEVVWLCASCHRLRHERMNGH